MPEQLQVPTWLHLLVWIVQNELGFLALILQDHSDWQRGYTVSLIICDGPKVIVQFRDSQQIVPR